LLNNAQFNPPSPIFTLSHPKCYCFLNCDPPFSPDQIPDDAPGLPLYGKREEIDEMKMGIFPNLQIISVDFLTLPPENTHYGTFGSMKKRYGAVKSYRISKPVIISQDFKCLLPMGFYRPLFKDLIGLQVEDSDFFATVYIQKLFRTFKFPKQFLSDYESEDFIKNNGFYRIKVRELPSGNVYYDSFTQELVVSD
jgi:hypothetical protein